MAQGLASHKVLKGLDSLRKAGISPTLSHRIADSREQGKSPH